MGKLLCFSSDEMINKVFISGNIVFLLMSLTDSQFSPFKICNKTSCFATFLKSKTVLKCWAHRRLNFVAKDKWWLSLFQAPSSILSSLSFLLEKSRINIWRSCTNTTHGYDTVLFPVSCTRCLAPIHNIQ